jgi:hypothetical protein
MFRGADWWSALVLIPIAGAPWIVGIAWFLRRRPRDGWIPPSVGDQLRRRFLMRQ